MKPHSETKNSCKQNMPNRVKQNRAPSEQAKLACCKKIVTGKIQKSGRSSPAFKNLNIKMLFLLSTKYYLTAVQAPLQSGVIALSHINADSVSAFEVSSPSSEISTAVYLSEATDLTSVNFPPLYAPT